MKPEKQNLLEDLRDDGGENRRESTLRAGAMILRRRRWKRVAGQMLGAATVMALGAFLAQSVMSHREAPMVAIAPMVAVAPVMEKATAAPAVHYLTDEELLAMFPNAPVALAKAGDKERLFFLNPADEKRYVARM